MFYAARTAGATILRKDQDFVDLVTVHGAPPQIILVTCGNTSNASLRGLFHRVFPQVIHLLESGEPLVELP